MNEKRVCEVKLMNSVKWHTMFNEMFVNILVVAEHFRKVYVSFKRPQDS